MIDFIDSLSNDQIFWLVIFGMSAVAIMFFEVTFAISRGYRRDSGRSWRSRNYRRRSWKGWLK